MTEEETDASLLSISQFSLANIMRILLHCGGSSVELRNLALTCSRCAQVLRDEKNTIAKSWLAARKIQRHFRNYYRGGLTLPKSSDHVQHIRLFNLSHNSAIRARKILDCAPSFRPSAFKRYKHVDYISLVHVSNRFYNLHCNIRYVLSTYRNERDPDFRNSMLKFPNSRYYPLPRSPDLLRSFTLSDNAFNGSNRAIRARLIIENDVWHEWCLRNAHAGHTCFLHLSTVPFMFYSVCIAVEFENDMTVCAPSIVLKAIVYNKFLESVQRPALYSKFAQSREVLWETIYNRHCPQPTQVFGSKRDWISIDGQRLDGK